MHTESISFCRITIINLMHLAVILRCSMHRRFCSCKFQIARVRGSIRWFIIGILQIYHVSWHDEDIPSLTYTSLIRFDGIVEINFPVFYHVLQHRFAMWFIFIPSVNLVCRDKAIKPSHYRRSYYSARENSLPYFEYGKSVFLPLFSLSINENSLKHSLHISLGDRIFIKRNSYCPNEP